MDYEVLRYSNLTLYGIYDTLWGSFITTKGLENHTVMIDNIIPVTENDQAND
jgi:hypothetical protein